MPKVLITGITGFVGGHLAEHLAGAGHTLAGLGRAATWPVRLEHLAGGVDLHAAELLDTARVEEVLKQVRPDWLFHLAGFASPRASVEKPDACWSDNLAATRSLYDAVARSGVRPRILYVSTGLIYGEPDTPEGACDERTTLKPDTPYAASKAAADILSYQYTRGPGLDIVRVRLFNQIGPRQSADYAVANFARLIVAAERRPKEPAMTTGNLSAHRDVTDVRDMVAAFPVLLDRGTSGEAYNAGSGTTYQMQELLDRMLALSSIPSEARPTAQPGGTATTAVTRADTSKLRAATGWKPHIAIDQTLTDILADWRQQAE